MLFPRAVLVEWRSCHARLLYPSVSRVCVPVFLVEQTGNPRRIFVGDLPTEFNKEELAKAFAKFGNVESTRLNAPRGSVPFVWTLVTAAVRVHRNGGLRADSVS